MMARYHGDLSSLFSIPNLPRIHIFAVSSGDCTVVVRDPSSKCTCNKSNTIANALKCI